MKRWHKHPEYLSKDKSIDELLAGWDRVGFGIACRQMEVLILRGQHDKALHVLRQQFARRSPVKPSLDSYVACVLPYRTAEMLEQNGFLTLAAVHKASDAQLLAIANMGPANVELIRQTCRSVIAGRPLPYSEDLSDLEPDWELPVLVQTKGDRIVSRIEEDLQVLLDAGEHGVAEIDAKIEKLSAEVENLRRMRKLLVPGSPKDKKAKRATGDYADMVKQIVEVIKSKGPMKASAVAEQLGTSNYTHIGRCVASAPQLLARNTSGEITLAGVA